MKLDYSDRSFQFWMFRNGHGEMLIRSPRDSVNRDNIDLIFVGVEYVDLPKVMVGLRVEPATPEDTRWLSDRLGRAIAEADVVVLETEGRRHRVLGSYFAVETNQLDTYELPFD